MLREDEDEFAVGSGQERKRRVRFRGRCVYRTVVGPAKAGAQP